MKNLSQFHLQKVMALHPDAAIASEAREIVCQINASKNLATLQANAKAAEIQRSHQEQSAKLAEIRARVRLASGCRSPLVIGQLVAWIERGKTGKVRGVFEQKRAKAIDHSATVIKALQALGAEDINTGNDAPRGGKCGWFAEVVW